MQAYEIGSRRGDEGWIQLCLDCRKINFIIFKAGMVARYGETGNGEQQDQDRLQERAGSAVGDGRRKRDVQQFIPGNRPSYSPSRAQITPALARCANGRDKLAIVLPALREGRNLPLVLENVRLVLQSVDIDWEVIVVDDDSGDGTEAIVDAVSQEDARIRLLTRRGERGLSGAILHGWRHTDATILGAMDADGQHPADVLPRLIACLRQGHDVAIASRYAEGATRTGSVMRRLASRVAILLARPLGAFDPPVRDPLSGFFLVRRHCVQNVFFQPAGFKASARDTGARARCKSARDPVLLRATPYGTKQGECSRGLGLLMVAGETAGREVRRGAQAGTIEGLNRSA